MNINKLTIFINVADAASITRAAEALHITQPAVRKAVKKLEDDLGVPLFFRDKRNGFALTDTGEHILGFARQMMLMEEKTYGRFKIVGAQTVRRIVEERIGIGLQAGSILPESTKAYLIYPIRPQIRSDFILIANRFDDLSPAVKAFIEMIHEIMRGSAAE